MAEEQNSTHMDDAVPGSTEDQMLADILGSSEIMQHATSDEVPEPRPELDIQDSDELVEDEDLETTEESATEDEVESDDADEEGNEQEEEGLSLIHI